MNKLTIGIYSFVVLVLLSAIVYFSVEDDIYSLRYSALVFWLFCNVYLIVVNFLQNRQFKDENR